jgi:hypothetical protein
MCHSVRQLTVLFIVGSIVTACSDAPTKPTSPSSNTSSRTISGVVREQHAPGQPPIAGASVTITSGLDAGRTVVTDTSGRYVFEEVTIESVDIRIEAEEFETRMSEGTPRQPADVLMEPTTSLIEWDSRTDNRSSFRIPFSVSHWGPATLSVFSSSFECGTIETFFAAVIEQETNTAWLNAITCRAGQTATDTKLLRPGDYYIDIYRTFTSVLRTNIVTLKHPR